MFLISSLYIIDYAINDKLVYESFLFHNVTNNIEDDERRYQDDELNPYFNFSISFKDSRYAIFNRFELPIEKDYIDKEGNYVYNFKERVGYIDMRIYYICGDDENCTTLNDIKDNVYGNISVKFPDYTIDNFDDPPIKKNDRKIDITLRQWYMLIYQEMSFEWQIKKYSDQKSLFDFLTNKKRDYIFGDADKNYQNFTIFEIGNDFYKKHRMRSNNYGYIFPLVKVKFEIDFNHFLYFKRKKISFLDVLANIFNLLSQKIFLMTAIPSSISIIIQIYGSLLIYYIGLLF